MTPAEKVIRAFLLDYIPESRQVMDLGVKDLLFDGFLDSIALMQAAAFREEAFGR